MQTNQIVQIGGGVFEVVNSGRDAHFIFKYFAPPTFSAGDVDNGEQLTNPLDGIFTPDEILMGEQRELTRWVDMLMSPPAGSPAPVLNVNGTVVGANSRTDEVPNRWRSWSEVQDAALMRLRYKLAQGHTDGYRPSDADYAPYAELYGRTPAALSARVYKIVAGKAVTVEQRRAARAAKVNKAMGGE